MNGFSLSRISIFRPVFAWMLMFALILFGSISVLNLGVSQLPDVDFPYVNVRVNWEGASPKVVETEVIEVLESAMLGVQGIRTMSSQARLGSAEVNLEFELNKNIDLVLQEVQSRVSQAVRKLPRDIDPPIVSKQSTDDQPLLWLGVQAKGWERQKLMAFVSDQIKDEFSNIEGVAGVQLAGYVDPALRIWVDPKKLKKFDFTLSDLLAALGVEAAEPPSGNWIAGGREFNVRTLAQSRSKTEIENIIVSARGGQQNFSRIRLSELASVEEGLADVKRISRINGETAIGLGILKQRGANAVQVARAIKAKVAQVNDRLPEGLKLGINFDNTTFVEHSISELVRTLLLSALLTALVCWLFLGSWTSTVNVLMAIPTSVIGTFIVLNFCGFTLNIFTLLGLSLAIGIVVDDSIMVLENIMRHFEMGKTRFRASLEGSGEITFSAVAATLSITAIFLPVAFMKGMIGKYFFQFGVTITAAVLISLLEALTLTPMRCAYFMQSVKVQGSHKKRSVDRAFDALQAYYVRGLQLCLKHRGVVIGLAVLLCVGSFGLLKVLKKELAPSIDQGILMVRMQAPPGTSLSAMDAYVQKVEQILSKLPEVERYYVNIGGMGTSVSNSAMAFLTLQEKSQRKKTQSEIMDLLRKQFMVLKPLKAFVMDLSMRSLGGNGRGFPIEFLLSGPDWDTLIEQTGHLKEVLESSGKLSDINTNFQEGMPELQLVPSRESAFRLGVKPEQVGLEVAGLVAGVRAGDFSAEGGAQSNHRQEIRVQIRRAQSDTEGELEKELGALLLRNSRGELVPLSKVVDVKHTKALQGIFREERKRAITFTANLKPGFSQQEVQQWLKGELAYSLKQGYTIQLSGTSQSTDETFTSLWFALVLGLIVAYMILGSQFNSWLDPVSVLIALPLSLTGAWGALWITGQSLNLYSMIGLILLMGITKKNSILLVDLTNQRFSKNLEGQNQLSVNARALALLSACPDRLRPILMTSIATIIGAVPAALSIGAGSETLRPMALVVIGGMLFSTLLTLFVVPCVHLGFLKFKKPAPEA